MKVETSEVEEGTRIDVEAEEKVAVVVEGEEERIYLPEAEASDSTYYVEKPETLVKTDEGWSVVHTGEVENIEVVS